jgi:TolB protein
MGVLLARWGLLLLLAHGLLIGGAVAVGAQLAPLQLVYQAYLTSANREIFLMDVRARLVCNLTRHPSNDMSPTWSPDGRHLAFESWRSGTRAVYVLDAIGSPPRRLTAGVGATEYAPQWAADGQSLLLRALRRTADGSPQEALYRVGLNGSPVEPVETALPPTDRPSEHSFTQQLRKGTWGIYVTEDGTRRQLTTGKLLFQETPRYSPDEQLIAFLSAGLAEATEVFVLRSDGSDLQQMTANALLKNNLSWRPW